MARSQNGWVANRRDLIATYTVPGTSVELPVRKGPVHVVLLYVAERYDREVERLHPGWCWGYAERPIRGGTALSNHASGTAIDLNAPAHPMGTNPRDNYSGQQIRAIRAILADCDGVVRWGGDYSGRKDGMHFEINTGAGPVRRLAHRIREDDVSAEDVWSYQWASGTNNEAWQAKTYLSNIERDGDWVRHHVSELRKQVAAQQAVLDKLADALANLGQLGDVDAFEQAIRQAIEDAVGNVDVELTVNDREV